MTDLTAALARIAALAEKAHEHRDYYAEAIEVGMVLDPAHMLEVVGMVRAEVQRLQRSQVVHTTKLYTPDESAAEIQRLTKDRDDWRTRAASRREECDEAEARCLRLTEERDEAIAAYNLVEKHRGEACALLVRLRRECCCELLIQPCEWCQEIDRELPRLSGGAIGGEDD